MLCRSKDSYIYAYKNKYVPLRAVHKCYLPLYTSFSKTLFDDLCLQIKCYYSIDTIDAMPYTFYFVFNGYTVQAEDALEFLHAFNITEFDIFGRIMNDKHIYSFTKEERKYFCDTFKIPKDIFNVSVLDYIYNDKEYHLYMAKFAVFNNDYCYASFKTISDKSASLPIKVFMQSMYDLKKHSDDYIAKEGFTIKCKYHKYVYTFIVEKDIVYMFYQSDKYSYRYNGKVLLSSFIRLFPSKTIKKDFLNQYNVYTKLNGGS